MTWLAPKLDKRIQIQQPTQTAASSGALEVTYTTIKTIWAQLKPVNRFNAYTAIIRGQNTNEGTETHVITVRSSALIGLNREWSRAFSSAFDNLDDISQIKSNYFIFLNHGSSVKGRRFVIKGIQLDEENEEYVKIYVEQMEEAGTGWPK
jgi:hypothetical protein